jgi:hypothetical protein
MFQTSKSVSAGIREKLVPERTKNWISPTDDLGRSAQLMGDGRAPTADRIYRMSVCADCVEKLENRRAPRISQRKRISNFCGWKAL